MFESALKELYQYTGKCQFSTQDELNNKSMIHPLQLDHATSYTQSACQTFSYFNGQNLVIETYVKTIDYYVNALAQKD